VGQGKETRRFSPTAPVSVNTGEEKRPDEWDRHEVHFDRRSDRLFGGSAEHLLMKQRGARWRAGKAARANPDEGEHRAGNEGKEKGKGKSMSFAIIVWGEQEKKRVNRALVGRSAWGNRKTKEGRKGGILTRSNSSPKWNWGTKETS